GIIPRGEELHANAKLGVPKVLAPLEGRQVTPAFQEAMDFLQPFASHEQIHVLGEAPVAVKEEGHPPDDRVRDAEFLESLSDLLQGLVDRTLLLEVHAALPQRPLQIAIEFFFVSEHGHSALSR